MAESLFRKATGDHHQSVTAAIFWLKARARWRETPRESGAPIDAPTVIELVAPETGVL